MSIDVGACDVKLKVRFAESWTRYRLRAFQEAMEAADIVRGYGIRSARSSSKIPACCRGGAEPLTSVRSASGARFRVLVGSRERNDPCSVLYTNQTKTVSCSFGHLGNVYYSRKRSCRFLP